MVGYAKYVGRVGALAVALGIGSAIAQTPIASASTGDGASASSSESDSSSPTSGSVKTSSKRADSGSGRADAGEPSAHDATDAVDSDTTNSGSDTDTEPATDVADGSSTNDVDDAADADRDIAALPSGRRGEKGSGSPRSAPAEDATPATPSTVADDDVTIVTDPVSTPIKSDPPRADAVVLESPTATTEPAAGPSAEAVTVAMTVISTLLGTGDPSGLPIGTPAEWMMLASARRKLSTPEVTDRSADDTASTALAEDDNRAPIATLAYVGQPSWITGNVSGDVNSWDPDWDRFTYSTSAPAKGSVRINRLGQFTYTPTAAARHGAAAVNASDADKSDTFTVTVIDTRGAATTLTVAVRIGAANRTPSARVVTVTDPEPGTGTVVGSVTATDRDGDPLVFAGPTATGKGSVAVNADGTFSYTPTPEARQAARFFWNRSDSFRVTVTDGHGGTGNVLVRVAITEPPANDPPRNGQVTRNPVGANGVVTGSVTATDADGDALSFSGSTTTAKGAATVNIDGTFIYTPIPAVRHAAAATNAASTGANRDSFTVTVNDGRGGTLNVPVSISIEPQNNAPTGAAATAAAPAIDGAVTGTVTASDRDNDTLTVARGATGPARGEVTVNADGTFVYRPSAVARHAAAADGAPDALKHDEFSVTISDGHGGITTLTVPVVISPHNDHPVVTGQSASEPGADGLVAGAVSATDRDNDSLLFSGPSTSERGGVVTVNANGSFSYRPSGQARQEAAQTPGVDTDAFTITVVDGHGGTATARVTVTVAPTTTAPNRAPTAVPTVGVANPDTWVVTGSLGATDPDGDALTYELQLPPRRGQVVIHRNGTFEYTPTALQAIEAYRSGSDETESFVVSISDGVNEPIVVTVSGLPIEPAEAAVTRVAHLPGRQITISSDGQLLFSVGRNSVDTYNARTLEGYGGWSAGGFVIGTAVAPNRTAYTISALDNDVRVYNAVSAQRITTVTVPGGDWNTIWAQGNRVYVSDGVVVSAIDTGTHAVVPVTSATQLPGQQPYAMGTLRAYVASSALGENFISILDRSTGVVTDKILYTDSGSSIVDLDLNPSGDLLYAVTSMGDLQIITLAVPDRLDPNPLATPPPAPADPNATPPKPTTLKPVSPLTVTQINYSTGTLGGTITAPGAQPGTPGLRYEGSTSGPLGSLTVNPDGGFSFTPSALARQYAADSGRIGRVAFIIKVINPDGSHSWLPLNVPLVPAGLPTDDVYPPVPILKMAERPNWDGVDWAIDITWAEGDPYKKAANEDPDHYPDNLPKYAAENWKYSRAILKNNQDNVPITQELFIVSMLNVRVPGTTLVDSYVIGYRKMQEIGQYVTVSNPTTSPALKNDLTYISHMALAYAPGTFPHHLFKQRIPGVVGGNIFDNEITALQWDFMQYATGDAQLQSSIDEINSNTQTFGKQFGVAADTAGQAAKGLYGGLGRPDRGDVAVLGFGLLGAGAEIFDLEEQDKVDETYGDGAYGLYYVMGPQSNLGQAPPVGVPD